VNCDARHLLRCSVARDAQAQKLLRSGGLDPVRAESRRDREVERELRDDSGFLARGVADHFERFSEVFDAEFHRAVSIVILTDDARTPGTRQEAISVRRCLILT
jgi:hypothetical protein